MGCGDWQLLRCAAFVVASASCSFSIRSIYSEVAILFWFDIEQSANSRRGGRNGRRAGRVTSAFSVRRPPNSTKFATPEIGFGVDLAPEKNRFRFGHKRARTQNESQTPHGTEEMPSNRCPLTAVLTPELTGMLPSQKLRVGNVAGSGRARPSCGDASCAVTPPPAAQPLRSLPRNVLHTIFSALPVCSVGLAASTNSHLRSAAREWVQRNHGAALGETDRRELKCAFEEWESIGLSAVASVQEEWSGKSAEQQTKMMADFCVQRERGATAHRPAGRPGRRHDPR